MTYNKNYNDKPSKKLQLQFNFNQDRYEGYCSKCLKQVTPRVADFSKKVFGMPLCWSCQHKPDALKKNEMIYK